MRALKWIVGGVLLLAVVLVLGVYFYLSSMDFNTLKPKIAQAVEDGTGRKLTMAGDIKLKISFSPSLTVENVSLANAPWGRRPQMIQVKKAEVEVALWPLLTDSRLEVLRLTLDQPDILIEIDKAGRSNLDMEPKAGKGEKPPAEAKAKARPQGGSEAAGPGFSLGFRKVLISQAKLELDDARSGEKTRLNLEKLALDSQGLGTPAQFELSGSANGKPFKAQGSFGPVGALTGRAKGPLQLKLSAQALGIELKIAGSLAKPLEGTGLKLDFQASGRDLAGLGLELPKASFSAKARLSDPKAKTYKLENLELTFGQSDLKGWLLADVSAKRPKLKAELQATTLDLAPFLDSGQAAKGSGAKAGAKPKAGGQAQKPGRAGQGQDRVFPRTKLELAALREADLDLKLKAAKLLTGKLGLADLNLALLLKDGRLSLKPLQAKLAGGTLDSSLALDASRPGLNRVSMEMEIQKLDLAKFWDEMKMERALEGTLGSKANFSGGGESVAAIMAGLNGKLAAVVKKGRLHKKHLNLLGAELASGLMGAFGNLFDKKDYTDLDCLVLGLVAKKGLAETTALAMQTPEMIMLGKGTINLKTEGIDFAIRPRPRKGVAGVSLSLGELVKPFKLGGTLAHPGLVLDEKEVAKTLGKTILGFTTYGASGLVLGLASTGGEVVELCQDAAQAAYKGVPYKPRYSKTEKTSDQAADSSKQTTPQKDQPPQPVQELEKGVGGVLKGLFGGKN